ncbi:hypothetical protein GCM10019059_07400 [Camelimonas fluminis]|uniref:Uncharacterized protein n=1 Tax=Camelimonas fluminis TaxID=1576911 RepID=A0ABV7UEC9_9HYPH|nr:hypothetical protein [Camelimonas fluminis]GHE50824.1 hypothetical protein GCM10019059_07400 [Camelimonas fluminis]
MKRIRDAQTIIGMLEGGETAAALGEELIATLAALKEHAGDRPKAKAKGKVTLTLNIEVEGVSATIGAEIASKRPKPVRGNSFFFVLQDGSLSDEHPTQGDMFSGPREVSRDREMA